MHKLGKMTSDYALVFFKNEEKNESRESFSARNSVRVWQVATGANDEVLCCKNEIVSATSGREHEQPVAC